MYYVVFHNISLRIHTKCETKAGAARSCAAKNKALRRNAEKNGDELRAEDYYMFTDEKNYDNNINVMTTTYSMNDPTRKPIPIRLADKGGCCDPATETYWSM